MDVYFHKKPPKLSLIFCSAIIGILPLKNFAEETELDAIKITGKDEPLGEISAKKLMRVPGSGNDPLRAIEALPGVVFSSGRESAPAVRGSSPEDNRYFIDFMPVQNIFHLDGSSLLNDNVVDSFKLEAAAFGAEYNDATGAVIAATSRAPYSDQKQAIIDFSLLRASILLESPITENQSAYLSVRQSLFQYYIENFLDDEEFEFTTVPEYFDYQGKYDIRLQNNGNISIQAIGSKDKAGLLFAEDSDEVQQDPGLSGGIDFNSQFHSQGIAWSNDFNNGSDAIISFSHMESDFDFSIGTANKLTATANDYYLRSNLNQPLGLNHSLKIGTEILQRHIEFDGDLTAPPCDELKPDCQIADAQERIISKDKLVINNYDVYLSDEWFIHPRLSLTPGVTWSSDDYTDQVFTQPKLKARWEFVDFMWLNAGWGEYHKFTDNFGQVAKGFGNPELDQPKSNHYTLGFEQQIDESLLWKFDTYYKTFDDIIVSTPDQTNYPDLTDEEYLALPRYTNDADGDAYGFEFFVNKNMTDDWYGWLSVAYSETRRRNKLTGEDFKYNYDQPWIINLVSSYELNEDWTLGLKWRYQSGQLVTPVVDTEPAQTLDGEEYVNPIYGELNSERLPAYHKLDARLDRSYQYTSWKMDLYIEALNLYNRANVTGYEYNGDYTEREDVTDLPLILSFGIKAYL